MPECTLFSIKMQFDMREHKSKKDIYANAFWAQKKIYFLGFN